MVYVHIHICIHFMSSSCDVVTVQYYDAVVEVCLYAANQKDPQDLALHHYKSGLPESDAPGRNALNDRWALILELHASTRIYFRFWILVCIM